ncbi:MAG: NAD(P)-binding protein [Lachnospiraceae bacterium]
MIRINQMKVPFQPGEIDLLPMILKTLKITEDQVLFYRIQKLSYDARKKPDIYAVYAVDVKIQHEERVLKKCKSKNIFATSKKKYHFPQRGEQVLSERPIIIGSGPAGLFCAYELALHGYRPLLLERGGDVDERTACVENFWKTGILDSNSNVQFGEGGAGTFSDGKLNTTIKDKDGRIQTLLELFVEHGAPEEVLYENKPHIGTDVLTNVVKNIRESIRKNGGEVRFHSEVTDVEIQNDTILSVTAQGQKIPASVVVLAIGHSARDTFSMLFEKGIPMEAKSFAVGLRIEHAQQMINENQYGRANCNGYPTADYKLTAKLPDGRGVYSFCMCPGGYVVNASSEPGRLAVNGMSYHDRAGGNANSAIVVTVSKEDYGDGHPLSGILFQQKLEEKAYAAAGGLVPVQRFEDYCKNIPSKEGSLCHPQIKGAYAPANLRPIFPEALAEAIEAGIRSFDKTIPGFAQKDVLLSGVESRTSSPVRITRNDSFQSSISGLYPCGEGAGYAGGITSAAIDGMKTAEMIAKTYGPFDEMCTPLRKI